MMRDTLMRDTLMRNRFDNEGYTLNEGGML